jgi:hypothetical protein
LISARQWWISPNEHACDEKAITLTDGTRTIYKTAYLHFQLGNCGENVPVVTGSTAIVQDSFDLRPATPGGSISGSILGNDHILCGNVASTNYVITQ